MNKLLLLGVWMLFTACDPFHTQFDDNEPARFYKAKNVEGDTVEKSTLTVMTWNIKYGGGRILFFWECGGRRGNMTESEVRGHMAGIAAKIRELDPDIVLLQEVDVQSKRSAYVDQVQYLLDHTHLNYGYYASAWKADFIPSDGLGRMDSGNAILSRWKLADGRRIALPLIGNYSAIEKYFYLKRNILTARVLHPVRPFTVVNIHAEAFAEDDTKKKHLEKFHEVLSALADQGILFIAGGDLNSIPKASMQRKDFPDDSCADARFKGDDYSGEEDWLDPLFEDFYSAVSPEAFAADPSSYFTFVGGDGSLPWNRCLDYLFSDRPFVEGSGRVEQSAQPPSPDPRMLSDHAPLLANWEVPR